MCASAAAPGRGTELIDSGRITGWMHRLRCVSKVCGPFGVPRRNAERNLHRVVPPVGSQTPPRGAGPAVFCSCYLPSRLYCRHRIFTGSASLAGGCLQRILIPDCGAWNHVSFTCLRERFAGCDRRFGISPTPEHDDASDYATARAGRIFSRRRNKLRDKMTFFDAP